jgi:hypothetical protein
MIAHFPGLAQALKYNFQSLAGLPW